MKFLSEHITAASGSIGGVTYSHNRGGMYRRARATPVNPNTPYQAAVRSTVALLADLWNSLLDVSERAAWDAYATAVPLLDQFGNPRPATGLNHYVRSNVPAVQAGLTRVDAAPVIQTKGSFTFPTFAAQEATDTVDVSFDTGDEWVGEDDSAMLIYASRAKGLGINYFKGPYRFAGRIDGDSVTPPTSPASIPLPFPLGAGQRLFLRVQVSRVDGRLSDSFRGQDDS